MTEEEIFEWLENNLGDGDNLSITMTRSEYGCWGSLQTGVKTVIYPSPDKSGQRPTSTLPELLSALISQV